MRFDRTYNGHETLIVLQDAEELTPDDLELPKSADRNASESELFRQRKSQAIGHFERNFVVKFLTIYGGNISRAAKAAGKDRRSFQRYKSPPSFDLEDPEVRLIDLDGDGVTDAIRSSTRLECVFNDPGLGWSRIVSVPRKPLEVFPDVSFADPRVKLGDMTGDGMLASFDGPAHAVRCAQSLVAATRAVDLDIRAGLHTGEVELRGDRIGGIAVHIAARVSALAGPGEVLVPRTFTDLVAGSGIDFEDRGEHTLKGIAEPWRLFAVTA